MSVEVPPMSKVMRSPWPSSRAACRLPAMPPAGPESTAPAASLHRVRDARHAAVGLHDEDLAPIAARLEPFFEAAQVGGQRRADIGIDHRRAEALVLLDLGQDLGRERHVDAGQEALEGAGASPARGAASRVGVEIADGDRADAHPLEPRDGGLEGAAVERRGDLAVEPHALPHPEAPRSRGASGIGGGMRRL